MRNPKQKTEDQGQRKKPLFSFEGFLFQAFPSDGLGRARVKDNEE
jgi:hypothetical protein